MSRTLIFAYGSNMHAERMRLRVPGAAVRGTGRLRGYAFRMDKRGRDGSAKANLAPDPTGEVFGVLWELSLAEVGELDRYEGGYEREAVTVERADGRVRAETYVSRRLLEGALPYDWYLEHILRGARDAALPSEYVAHLAGHATQPGKEPL